MAKTKRSKVPGTRARPAPTDPETYATAFHEAAHIVVAHALGLRPTYARCVPRSLPADAPTNLLGDDAITYGQTTIEPQLADEIVARYRAGQPPTAEEREWLLAESVILAAGVAAEGGPSAPGSEGDMLAIVQCAGILGHEERRGVFGPLALDAARAVLLDLEEVRDRVARELAQRGELDADPLAALLGGSPRGSHTGVLDELRRLDEEEQPPS